MLDFREILDRTQLYNFHTHTQYCDGRNTMQEIVEQAIKEGFRDLGFSPHSPVPIESPCNMKKEEVASYLNEINRLKSLYGSKISIYASMEIDYLDSWGPSHEYFQKLPLDYRIGSIHFIPSFMQENTYVDVDGSFENFKKKMSLHFNNDIVSVVKSFYTQSLKMINAGGFNIIGHFDKIGFNAGMYSPGIENEKWYNDIVREVFDAIMDNRYIIEINTKAYETQHRFFPNKKYFELIKKYKAPVIINSDAHFYELLNSGREIAMDYLNSI